MTSLGVFHYQLIEVFNACPCLHFIDPYEAVIEKPSEKIYSSQWLLEGFVLGVKFTVLK